MRSSNKSIDMQGAGPSLVASCLLAMCAVLSLNSAVLSLDAFGSSTLFKLRVLMAGSVLVCAMACYVCKMAGAVYRLPSLICIIADVSQLKIASISAIG